jgi:predicted dehydrogenase
MITDTVRWGILGCGTIARKLAEALQVVPGAVCHAAGARDLSRAREFADAYGFARAHGSYTELVKDPDVDIVYIATPHSHHYLHTKLCLEHGKHVLCEKPFTVNLAQLDVLLRMAQERDLFLMEALWTRFLPHIIKTRELLENRVIGIPVTMHADFGFRAPYDPSHRLFNPHLAGGALLDIGIYPLFLSLFLFGQPSSHSSHSRLTDNGIDLVTSIITESEAGVVSNLSCTTIADTPTEAIIYGTSGKLRINPLWFTPSDLSLHLHEKDEKVLKFPVQANGYELEVIECMHCLQHGSNQSSMISHSFSRQLMEIMDRIRNKNGIRYPDEIESVERPFGMDEL